MSIDALSFLTIVPLVVALCWKETLQSAEVSLGLGQKRF